jgi:hypothetical protein
MSIPVEPINTTTNQPVIEANQPVIETNQTTNSLDIETNTNQGPGKIYHPHPKYIEDGKKMEPESSHPGIFIFDPTNTSFSKEELTRMCEPATIWVCRASGQDLFVRFKHRGKAVEFFRSLHIQDWEWMDQETTDDDTSIATAMIFEPWSIATSSKSKIFLGSTCFFQILLLDGIEESGTSEDPEHPTSILVDQDRLQEHIDQNHHSNHFNPAKGLKTGKYNGFDIFI